MKYRIWNKSKLFKLQRKKFLCWVWLDVCNKWCNWYGKCNPRFFYSFEEAVEYMDCDFKGDTNWKLITEDTIDDFQGTEEE